MELNTPQDFIEMGLRRKWWIIIPLIVCLSVSFGLYKKLPKIYRATTLILALPPELPEDYITPTVKSSVAGRLNTLNQQILSRTNLERVIKELNPYSDEKRKASPEGTIEAMRQAFTIEVQRARGRTRNPEVQNTFTISYEGKDPRMVMMVTNRLASLFIEENLKTREKQALGTVDFIEHELSAIEGALKEKERQIRTFKERYMGELPEQFEANLRTLASIQDQIKENNDNAKTAEERHIKLTQTISEFPQEEASSVGEAAVSESPFTRQLNQLNARLNELQAMYTDKHPDVVDTKTQIAILEKKIAQQGDVKGNARSARSERSSPVLNSTVARLKVELSQVEVEIIRLRNQGESLKEQLAMYQKRVENTPMREQELSALTRDYDLMKTNYQSLLDKKMQANMAEKLERQQLTEQYKILDPASMPERPFKPNREKIMLFGGLLGLLLGGGLAYLRESSDRSFHKIDEVEDYMGFPVIATLPYIKKE